MNTNLLNVSSSPHIRHHITTGSVMRDVILALMPATVFGVYHFGVTALLIILVSILASVLTEFVFDRIAGKPDTWKNGSAVLTGLLLALSLSPTVPLYIPALGGIFAILFVKCLFGGLGKNFMNPAVAARCFLLLSFGSAMTDYAVDGMSSATPLALVQSGETMRFLEVFIGNTTGVIGCSALGLLLGGIFLLILRGITWEIPVSCIVVFAAVMTVFGGRGFNLTWLLTQICGGGVLMGAFFMATDPVTSPVISSGQLLYGAFIGALAALFRVAGTAPDSFSYAIVIANMIVPFIDKIPIPKPLGYKTEGEYKEFEFPKAAVNLCVITLVAGFALSGVFMLTKDAIDEQKRAAQMESYKTVCPQAETFVSDEALDAAVAALDGAPYNTANFGKTYINGIFKGLTAEGTDAGYVITVTSADGFEGNISLSVGLMADGTVNGIAFTELNETAGMGMLCGEEAFYSQFAGVQTDAFVLNKAGGSTQSHEIDSVSGASVSSGAVVNAVNTALAFFAENIQ